MPWKTKVGGKNTYLIIQDILLISILKKKSGKNSTHNGLNWSQNKANQASKRILQWKFQNTEETLNIILEYRKTSCASTFGALAL